VSMDTSLSELVAMLAVEPECATISFDDEDLPEYGASHAKALYISISMNSMVVPLTLIDNGSALNICP
ncbi:hypothetical protein, partial [Serratia marcescens]|uniref:hypothetical protein n=1 Tax=Serratia marcescens TaxID=615 RepID=UPI002813E576